MDTRQAQINTFTDGLNTDLHPLTTPNTVLTDCINGTIITYNGNEYILQNDMGNYKLKYATLTPNYIPIGVKEYAGILYIVSYNPIDKLTEVGSYPSPKSIFDSNVDPKEKEAKYIELPDTYNKYTELSKKQVIQLYSTEDNFMLNPGDKYYVYLNLEEDKLYQTIEFYVLSQEKNLFPLKDGDIKLNSTDSSGDRSQYSSVRWEIPGWLAYKFRLATIDQFNLYLTKLNHNELRLNDNDNINLDYSVTAQAITSDFLFDESNLIDKLKVWIAVGYIDDDGTKRYHGSNSETSESLKLNTEQITKTDNSWDNKFDYGVLCKMSEIEYTSINKFLFTEDIDPTSLEKYSKLNIPIDNGNKTIFIEAIPLIEVKKTVIENGEEKEKPKYIVYDNFETTLTVNLSAVKNIKDIKVFDTYKYLVSNEGVVLNYTINSPISQISNLLTELRIYKITRRDENTYNLRLAWAQEINEINYFSQNITTCNFTTKNNPETYTIGNETIEETFEKEEIYLLQLRIYIDGGNKTKHHNWYKLLITSELMNSFYNDVNDFAEIKLSEWMSKLTNYVELPNVTISSNEITDADLKIYRNEGKEDNLSNEHRVYRLRKDDDGEWQDNYDCTSIMSIDEKTDYPEIGVQAKTNITIDNYTLKIFDNKGIWKGYEDGDWHFTFNIKTASNETLEFWYNPEKIQESEKRNITSIPIQLYKYFRLNINQTKMQEKIWDRIYIYDVAPTTIKPNRAKKYMQRAMWGIQNCYLEDGLASIERWTQLYWKKLEVNEITPPKLLDDELNFARYENGSVGGFYNSWKNGGIGINPLMFTWYNVNQTSGPEKENICINAYNTGPQWNIVAIRIATNYKGNLVWCVIPMWDGNIKLDNDTDYYNEQLRNHLLSIIDQLAIHVFAYVEPEFGPTDKNLFLLSPDSIRIKEKLSETLTTGIYTWTLNDIIWNNKEITKNTVNNNTLYLNGKLLEEGKASIVVTNLENSTLSITKSKLINLNKQISGDLTKKITYNDNYSNGDKEISIEDIETDINDFFSIMQTLSTKKQDDITNTWNIQPYTVAHDLRELSNINNEVISSFDSFVKYLRAKDSKMFEIFNFDVQFYSIYEPDPNYQVVFGRYKSGEWDLTYNQGYVLPPTSEFKLPLIVDDTLWNNVSPNFYKKD